MRAGMKETVGVSVGTGVRNILATVEEFERKAAPHCERDPSDSQPLLDTRYGVIALFEVITRHGARMM